MDTINIDNDYYFELEHYDIKKEDYSVDVKKINLKNIMKERKFILLIDFKTFQEKDYKKLLKRILLMKKIALINHIEIGQTKNSKKFIGYLINYDKNNKVQNDFILGINAILYKSRYEMYNYIYDTVCDYLDEAFYGKNLCDFKNNQCGEKKGTSVLIGCCRHFKYKKLGLLSKLVPCEYLTEDYKCQAKCIGCKLFTCDYLRKKGVEFKIKDILLLDTFFNPIQKYIIKYSVFNTKEEIIRKLLYF